MIEFLNYQISLRVIHLLMLAGCYLVYKIRMKEKRNEENFYRRYRENTFNTKR